MSVRTLLIAAAAVLGAIAATTTGPGPTGAAASNGTPERAAALHGSGLYTASVRSHFRDAATCTLVPSVGDPVPVRVEVSGPAGDDAHVVDRRVDLEVNRGDREVAAGTWVAFSLRGFAPGDYVEIAVDVERAYTVRTDERGRFDRHALIPRGLSAGAHTVTASQGERSADADIRVR